MAELHSTSRRINSPCLFSSSSGSFNAAPVAGLRQFCGADRAFIVLNPAVSRSRLRGLSVLSGAIVTIESARAAKFRVTTSVATGRLRAAATCW